MASGVLNRCGACSRILEPTVSYIPCNGKVAFEAFGRPTDYAGILENPELLKRVATRLRDVYGITHLYVPKLGSKTLNIVPGGPGCFPDHVTIQGVNIFSGIIAEGVKLPPQTAGWIAPADSPTLVLASPKTKFIVYAHTGRDNLIDRQLIFEGRTVRKLETVVKSAVETLISVRVRQVDIESALLLGIRPPNFPHPSDHQKYGPFNQKMIAYLTNKWGKGVVRVHQEYSLDLAELVRTQLASFGVPTEGGAFEYDADMDTFSAVHPDTNIEMWHSHARDSQHGGSGFARNGVLVVNRNRVED